MVCARCTPAPLRSVPLTMVMPSGACTTESGSPSPSRSPHVARLVEEIGLLEGDLLVERSEVGVAADVLTDLGLGELGHIVVDEDRRACRLGHELCLARALHRHEPPHRLLDRVADREQTV